jgi:hypothetical protein
MLKGVGTIRLIDKSLPPTNLISHCTDKETELSWNQSGPAGSRGPKGETGPVGPKGEPGESENGTDSLEDLAGLPCHTPDFQGVVEIFSTPPVGEVGVDRREVHDPELGNPDHPSRGPTPAAGHECVYAVPLGTQLTLTGDTAVSGPKVQHDLHRLGFSKRMLANAFGVVHVHGER